ncbi:hypothetical protein DE146DRAFT_611441 [Phaeosphaeria sp. MPI-PUGE-AT-0046c]|nr:hypothetical protein DE146DRAFT_611441 [Phaeosphaeria sp. MPI-PUGE-AT-0046c]
MNLLPQELICEICVHLNDEDLRTASFVSTRFRSAAENCASGHRQHVVKYPTEKRFLARYSGFRHRYIKEIHFTVRVPLADYERGCQRERLSEQNARDSAFTDQVRELFVALVKVGLQAGARNPGTYHLSILCSSRHVLPDVCPHGDHAYRRTHLLEHDTMPILGSVRSLELQNVEPGIKLGYRVLLDLITHFPNLENIAFHTGTDDWTPSYEREPALLYPWEYDGLRRDTRHDFSDAMANWTIPCNLKRVNLDFICSRGMTGADGVHHWHSQPNLVSPAIADPFSRSLHVLSHHLREIILRAQIDESFFWPHDDSTPTWPNLEQFFIMFHMVAPSGSWYFEGPRGEGRDLSGHALDEDSYPSDNDDEDYCPSDERDRSFEEYTTFWFRVSPNIKVLRPLLLGFAKAAANMPTLKQAVLWAPLKWYPDGDDDYDGAMFDYFQGPDNAYSDEFAWGVAYCCPGEYAFIETNDNRPKCKIRHLGWEVGNWRPDPSLAEAFREIGRAEHGNDLDEVFARGDTHSLTYRYKCEEFVPRVE